MGENAKTENNAKPEAAPKKKSWWKGVKSEFSKIVWPTRETLAKETLAVVVYTAVLAVIIAVLDFIFQFGIDKLFDI